MRQFALIKLGLAFATAPLASVAHAADLVAAYEWTALAEAGSVLPGATVTNNGRVALRIENTNQTSLQVRLLDIQKPALSATYYAINGEIKYTNVHGDGFLEMWNIFPPTKAGSPEARFFSRTLGVTGEMGKITGSSDWRLFALPFDRTGSSAPPSMLEINLILPGPGTVYIGSLSLVQYPGGPPFGVTRAWWSARSSGMIAGIAGAIIGCFASLLSWLAARRKARGFVLASTWSLVILGAFLALSGTLAASARQPYAVWFPLLLCGLLLLIIAPGRLRQFHRLYETHELRRIEAADAG